MKASTKTQSGTGVGAFSHATDNSDMVGKKLIRDWCMERFGGAANCSVLELFGGLGHVHDHCYIDPPVKRHTAFELRAVDRPTWLVGDNQVLITKHVQGWDLYDLDAYSNPWVLAATIAKIRKPGRFVFAMTCGIGRGLRTGETNGYVRQTCGYNGMPHTGLLYRFYDDIVRCMVNDWRQYGVTVLDSKFTKSVGSQTVTYYAFELLKK